MVGISILAGIGVGALGARLADRPAGAAEGGSVMPVFAYELPNLPGQTMTGVLVEYAPGGSSPPHHHTSKGSVVAYVLEGAIRSKVDDGPETVYQAGLRLLYLPRRAGGAQRFLLEDRCVDDALIVDPILPRNPSGIS
ncbi:MAG: cupin domain-containing protein [Geminicoccaceae bacterium]